MNKNDKAATKNTELSKKLEMKNNQKSQTKNIKEMKAQVNKANFKQREYDNLDFLYANTSIHVNSNNDVVANLESKQSFN